MQIDNSAALEEGIQMMALKMCIYYQITLMILVSYM